MNIYYPSQGPHSGVRKQFALPPHSYKVAGSNLGLVTFLCGVCMFCVCLWWFSPVFLGSGNCKLSVCLYVVVRWAGHLSRLSPCPHPMTAGIGSSRPIVTLSSGRGVYCILIILATSFDLWLRKLCVNWETILPKWVFCQDTVMELVTRFDVLL